MQAFNVHFETILTHILLTQNNAEKGFLNVNLLQQGLCDGVKELECGTPPEGHPHP